MSTCTSWAACYIARLYGAYLYRSAACGCSTMTAARSACYDSLRINTSKLVTRFHDFPVPKHYPMFCSHQEVGTPSHWAVSICSCTERHARTQATP